MYTQLTLLIRNHGCNLTVSPFNTFQARFKEFGDEGLSSTLKVYKVFTKVIPPPWLTGDCLGPAGVINCTSLFALSFWVSLFPRMCGCNNSLSGWHSPSLPHVSAWTPQSQNHLWSSVLPLYPDTKLNLRVLGKLKKKSFTDLPGKGG